MSDISDDRKKQIEAEERYRIKVRKELEAEQGTAPVTTVKGHAPGPKKPPPEPAVVSASGAPAPERRTGGKRGGVILVALGVLLAVAGVVMVVLGATGKPGEPPEKTAAGGGALAAAAPAWNPAELGYEELDVKDGTATVIPATGTTTLAELRAQEAEGPHGPGDPDEPTPPRPPAAATGALDPLLAHVPADAFGLVALDLDKVRGSPALMDTLDMLVRQSGLADRIGSYTGAAAIVIAGVPSAPQEDPWPIIVVREPSGSMRVVAAPQIQDRAMAAPSGGNVLDSGGLRDALAAVRAGPAGFAAIRMIDDARAELARLLPGLEKIQWLAGTIDTSAGIALSGSAVFPDDTSAASVTMAVNVGKSLAKSQLPMQAAAAVDKLAFTAVGNAVRISARWTEADVAALSAAAR